MSCLCFVAAFLFLSYTRWDAIHSPALIADETFYFHWGRLARLLRWDWLQVSSTVLFPTLLAPFSESVALSRFFVVALASAGVAGWFLVARRFMGMPASAVTVAIIVLHPGFRIFGTVLYSEAGLLLFSSCFVLALDRLVSEEPSQRLTQLSFAIFFCLLVFEKTALLLWMFPTLSFIWMTAGRYERAIAKTKEGIFLMTPTVALHQLLSWSVGNKIALSKSQDWRGIFRIEPLLETFWFLGPVLCCLAVLTAGICLWRSNRGSHLLWFPALTFLGFLTFRPFFPYYAFLFLPFIAVHVGSGLEVLHKSLPGAARAAGILISVGVAILTGSFWRNNPSYFHEHDNRYITHAEGCQNIAALHSSCTSAPVSLPYLIQPFGSDCTYSALVTFNNPDSEFYLSYVDDGGSLKVDGEPKAALNWKNFAIVPVTAAAGTHRIEVAVVNHTGIGGIGQLMLCERNRVPRFPPMPTE